MQPEANLLYQEKNRKPFHPRSHGVQVGFTVRNPTRRNCLFFSQSEHKGHWDECETILLNKVVTWKALYLVAIKNYRWFNSIFKKYGENRFRSIFHIRRNIRISSTVSYFNILLSVIFQLCLLSNKESFFQDMRCFSTSERIPVRITCNSRHTLLYYLYV